MKIIVSIITKSLNLFFKTLFGFSSLAKAPVYINKRMNLKAMDDKICKRKPPQITKSGKINKKIIIIRKKKTKETPLLNVSVI